MASPIWITPTGTIGTFMPGELMFPVQLVARPVTPATSVIYQIIGGSLPAGVNMNSSGLISGTPSNLLNDVIFSFVVRAIDDLGNIADIGLTMRVSNNTPVWVTPAGSLGVFSSGISLTYQLIATSVLPAVSISYTLLSGNLPAGIVVNEFGTIIGTPLAVLTDTLSDFVVRATDNQGNIRDRTFSITIAGSPAPSFTIPEGSLFSVTDSVWVEFPVTYSNPISENIVTVRLIQGNLPEGLEINEFGLIRGYPVPPTQPQSYAQITTTVTATNASNAITCFSTSGFATGRPIVFTGSAFGGLVSGQTYYIKEVLTTSSFTISTTIDGPEIALSVANGFLAVTLPSVTEGQPAVKTSTFVVELVSDDGNDSAQYSITITNRTLPISQGGPGFPANTRTPTLLNTRPMSYDISQPSELFGYYVLPDLISGETYAPGIDAYIGKFEDQTLFSFKMLGYDFDGNQLTYNFTDLPIGFTGDSTTGWITGNVNITANSIIQFSFKASVSKTINPSISSPVFSFSFNAASNISELVTWITDSNLGTINNGSVSIKSIEALTAQNTTLTYVTSDILPPNLTLLPNGDIVGVVAYQPETSELQTGDSFVYNFTVTAYSQQFPVITSSKTFTLTVLTEFQEPSDSLYIKCAPSIEDRNVLRTLLEQPSTVTDPLIPKAYLFRPNDPNFGKSKNVIYAHAFGINASAFDEYVEAVTKNHYWRDLTLGQIETAQARDERGNVIYEVVYSRVIDNLVNSDGISISEEIVWPTPITLPEGGVVQTLYPNSLPNMRDRVGQVLGQDFNSKVLPLWMTSQQENGSTLGFVPAWVICYTKPGFANMIKENIETKWKNEIGQLMTLNQIDFQIDRFYVDKSLTYDYEKNFPDYTTLTAAIELNSTTIVVADTYLLGNEGYIKINQELLSYSQINRITNTLSGITRGLNGTIPTIHQIGDAVFVDLSYWANLPSATPVPDPIDSRDFYVLFPRKTILPSNS